MLKLIETSDGSHTLLDTSLHETYHSVHGAIQESQHVFIRNGLQAYISGKPVSAIRILEIGFGTGLNALLTLLDPASGGWAIHYTAIEPNPLTGKIIKSLNYPQLIENQEAVLHFLNIHKADWNTEIRSTPNFTIYKIENTVQKTSLPESNYDIVYFDAFAPGKQPEMWEIDILRKVGLSIKKGGILVTYCAKGQVKRDLKSLGFQVESLAGPPGKAQMVRAIKNFPLASPL